MADYYDIDRILSEATRIDIAPDRLEWVKLCHALKILGYDETYFVALCRPHPGATDQVSRRKWREEKNPTRYLKGEDDARAFIAAVAKLHGIDISRMVMPREEWKQRQTYHRQGKPRTMSQAMLNAIPTATAPASPPREVKHIEQSTLMKMMAAAKDTALFKFMCAQFPDQASMIQTIFAAYMVGGSKHTDRHGNRATSFPYINTKGQCVDCKVFHIDEVSGSRKKADPIRTWTDKEGTAQALQSTWALAEMRLKEHRDPTWCNFGDHLLADRPGVEVAVVESEKSALIAALVIPSKVWVAVGSMQNLTPQRCEPYRGRTITIFPDRDGIATWEDKAKTLREHGFVVQMSRIFDRYPGEPKDDIADIILRIAHGNQAKPQPKAPIQHPLTEAEEVWQQMKAKNPFLVELEEALQLKIIGFAPDNHNP